MYMYIVYITTTHMHIIQKYLSTQTPIPHVLLSLPEFHHHSVQQLAMPMCHDVFKRSLTSDVAIFTLAPAANKLCTTSR